VIVYIITVEFQEQKYTFLSINKQFYLKIYVMANETGGMSFDELNSWWQVREDTNKVTEEAVRRIQDNQKKAQQIGQDIKNDKATNDKFANFLAFLLSDIKSDTLIKQLYQTFFTTIEQESEAPNIKNNRDIALIVGMFVPFYEQHIKEIQLNDHYQDIRPFEGNISLTIYIEYIKKLITKHQKHMNLKKESFAKLLSYLGEYYQLIEKLSPEKANEFEITIQKELNLHE